MKYLVTGGCGFIGSNAVDYLVNKGHEVCVIDDLSSDAHDSFYYNHAAKYYHYNVNDYTMCSDVFKKHLPDFVLHFAAEARITNCINDPSKAFESNMMGTITMLDLCKKHKVKKLILSSTSAIYGSNAGQQNENMNSDCLNPYSLSKLHAEQCCKLYGLMYGLETVCLRYFNVYGPRNPSKGQYAPVIGIFQKQNLNKENLTIVGDGEQTRDFVHVLDVIKANYKACNLNKSLYGETINIGTGKSYSINDIAHTIQPNTAKHTFLPQRPLECRHTNANIFKAREILNWQPEIDVLEWIKNK
jgi:UDP-glucose 4-epimerase